MHLTQNEVILKLKKNKIYNVAHLKRYFLHLIFHETFKIDIFLLKFLLTVFVNMISVNKYTQMFCKTTQTKKKVIDEKKIL